MVITSANFFVYAYSINQHKSSHFRLKSFSSYLRYVLVPFYAPLLPSGS